jgi:DNA mismatch endonuclease (patch repair protein)
MAVAARARYPMQALTPLPPFNTPDAIRSRNMAAIRSRNTKPELAVRRIVHAAGFRYRLHSKLVPGKPDLVFGRLRLAVFVHGCFWHGHDCSKGHVPRSNTEYWSAKIKRNVERDAATVSRLSEVGWKTLVIRECQLEEGVQELITTLIKDNLPKPLTQLSA